VAQHHARALMMLGPLGVLDVAALGVFLSCWFG
jgi:hypothetical protein